MYLNRRFRLRAGIVLALNVALAVLQTGPANGQAAGGLQKGDDAIGAPAASKENPPDPRLQRGRELFIKRWKNADVASPTGDGLGPVFNGRSCAECHNQTRPGGAGSIEHNVDLLSVFPPNLHTQDRSKFTERMAAIDPAFTADFTSVRPNVTLHKFGTDPEYDHWRKGVVDIVARSDAGAAATDRSARESNGRQSVKQLLSLNGSNRAAPESKRATDDKSPLKLDRLHMMITQRSTPALFGAGLIDTIPDDVLRDIAKTQADKHGPIKGQVAVATGGRAGKFGWRGQTADLKEFVVGACANELGLQVPGHNQGIDPLDPTYRAPGLDLTQEQCDDLAAFVASLPRPQQRAPKNADERDAWQAGEHAFETVGCANCHVRTLGTVEGLYSDLLLHDLGPRLADPAGTNPSSSPGASGAAYYGGPTDVFAQTPPITRRQWRTPPLWGVADSAPYLHDGRAATLEEAIKAHAGEAAISARLFAALRAAEREKLLAFLGSLAAPKETTRLAQD
jgi:CxxC motif-containing protein (DUF1111 family)